MYNLFGSDSKEEILKYLAKQGDKTVKEISEETNIGYKNASKILTEFSELYIVSKKDNKYYLNSKFIEYFKKLSDVMCDTYTNELYFRNKTDLYNAMLSLNNNKEVKDQVNELIDSWFMKRIDDWYSKYYDPENKEFNKIIELVEEKYKNDRHLEILEVGSGTGRLSFQLIKKYPNLTAIDASDKFIEYSKHKAKKSKEKINFIHADIKDFKSDKKYDVILFGWIGFHSQEDVDAIIENLKNLVKKNTLILILDAYYDTEYIDILQQIREVDMGKSKLIRDKVKEKLIKEFGNYNEEVLLTHYKFDTIKDVVDNFKIELTLEESHLWTKDDEEKLKKYLLGKKDPLIIGEGLWISVINVE